MFDIGGSELLVIAIVALIVFPTKDLPRLMRTAGQVVGRLRRMAGEFQSQVNSALSEAEREIAESEGKETLSALNPLADLRKTLDPIRSIGDDIKRSVTAPPAPKPAEPAPVPPEAAPSEPAPVAACEPPPATEAATTETKGGPAS